MTRRKQPTPLTPEPDLGACPFSHQTVYQEANDWLDYTLAKQRQRGFETYGHELLAHDGRDHWQDLMDELADAANYTTVLRQEWHCQREELAVIRQQLDERDQRIAELEAALAEAHEDLKTRTRGAA